MHIAHGTNVYVREMSATVTMCFMQNCDDFPESAWYTPMGADLGERGHLPLPRKNNKNLWISLFLLSSLVHLIVYETKKLFTDSIWLYFVYYNIFYKIFVFIYILETVFAPPPPFYSKTFPTCSLWHTYVPWYTRVTGSVRVGVKDEITCTSVLRYMTLAERLRRRKRSTANSRSGVDSIRIPRGTWTRRVAFVLGITLEKNHLTERLSECFFVWKYSCKNIMIMRNAYSIYTNIYI